MRRILFVFVLICAGLELSVVVDWHTGSLLAIWLFLLPVLGRTAALAAASSGASAGRGQPVVRSLLDTVVLAVSLIPCAMSVGMALGQALGMAAAILGSQQPEWWFRADSAIFASLAGLLAWRRWWSPEY